MLDYFERRKIAFFTCNWILEELGIQKTRGYQNCSRILVGKKPYRHVLFHWQMTQITFFSWPLNSFHPSCFMSICILLFSTILLLPLLLSLHGIYAPSMKWTGCPVIVDHFSFFRVFVGKIQTSHRFHLISWDFHRCFEKNPNDTFQ